MRRRTAVVLTAAVLAVAGFIAAAVVAFPHGTPTRATSRPVALPSQLAPAVYDACMPGDELAAIHANSLAMSINGWGRGLVFGIQDQGVWEITVDRHGGRVRRENEVSGDGSDLPYAQAAAAQFYACLTPYRFANGSTETPSASQLLQLYRYDRTVLWPCLASMGVHVGKPPTRQDFIDSFRASAVNPFGGVAMSSRELPRLIHAAAQCPMRPGFLEPGAPRSAG